MICLNCYCDEMPVLEKVYATSLTDGRLWHAHCIKCGKSMDVTDKQLTARKQAEQTQKMFLEKSKNGELKEKHVIDYFGRKKQGRNFAYFEPKKREV